jgi:hypothetical protein
VPLPSGDPLAMLDARITVVRARRGSSARFSEAYWEADDDLAWLRMVRDELARTGHLRAELRAILFATQVAVEVSLAAPSRQDGGRPSAAPGSGEPADLDELALPVGAGVA